MKISLFDHRADNVPKAVERTREQLCQRLAEPVVRAEKDGLLVSPASFSPARRLKENVVDVSFLAYDCDHGSTLDGLIKQLQKLACAGAIYTTHSHQRVTESNPLAEERYRVFVFLNEPVPVAKYESLWERVASVAGLQADRGARDASRMYYTPAKASDDAPYQFHIEDGEPLNWRELDLEEVISPPVPRVRASENGHAKNIDELIRAAARATNGRETVALLGGDTSAFGGDASRADLALASRFGFFSGPDPMLLELMMRRSRLERPKWDEKHYGDGRTYIQGVIDKALSGRTEFYSNGNGHQPSQAKADEWEPPAAFYQYDLPEFPVSELPTVLQPFVHGLARETQTPVDLAGMLALTVIAGAVGGHVRVQARKGWSEPTNIYVSVVLPSGNRKSAAFS